MQTIVSRNVDPLDSAVVTLGVIEGGTQSNIIAKEVKIEGTIRTLNNETRPLILKRMKEIVAHTTKTYGADYELMFDSNTYIALINTDEIVDIVKNSGQKLLVEESIIHVE